MARSNLVNAVDVALAADVGGADSTITVTDETVLPPTPFYLVVDPFGDNTREYMLCTSAAGAVLSVNRNLAGSEATTHAAGDIVRIAYVAQLLDDIWAEMDLYLPLAGGTMSGPINMGDSYFLDVDSLQGSPGESLVIRSTGGGRIDLWDDIGQSRLRIEANANGDIALDRANGATVLLWDESDGRWEFKDTGVPPAFDAGLSAGSQNITSVADPINAQHAATKNYVDGEVGNYLPLAGGVMSGNIDFNGTQPFGLRSLEGRTDGPFIIKPGPGQTFSIQRDTTLQAFRLLTNASITFYKADGATIAGQYSGPADEWQLKVALDMGGNAISNSGRVSATGFLLTADGAISDKDGVSRIWFDDTGTHLYSPEGGGPKMQIRDANIRLGVNLSGEDTYTAIGLRDPTNPQDAATKAYVDGGGQHTISDTAPSAPALNDVWVDPTAGGGVSPFLPLTGGTITGNLVVDDSFAGRGMVLAQQAFVSAEVPDNSLLASLIIPNPGLDAGSIVYIEVVGMAGFAGIDVDVGVLISGPTDVYTQRATAVATKWAAYSAVSTWTFDTSGSADKLIEIRSGSSSGAYFRGLVKVWVQSAF